MPENKSHHYVPQMYMRLFSEDATRVGVFVIRTGKFIPQAPIRGQACRDYFYGKDPSAERAFGTIEGHAAKLFKDAIEYRTLPASGSEDHERLIFFLGIQHCRTMTAAEQHNEGSVKALKAVLRRKAELEGNDFILEHLDKVRITRTNAVSEIVSYATIGANLLADLAFVVVVNESEVAFVSSDAPVVLHNRLFEGQHINVTGYANVGLQLFLPLGPRLALFGYDPAAYYVSANGRGAVRVTDAADVRLINDLQWEAAHAVMLVAPDTAREELVFCGTRWRSLRKTERVLFREEVVEDNGDQVRTRQGSGEAPSSIALDLSFVELRLPIPPRLGSYEIPPFRDPARVARTDRAFAVMDDLEGRRRRG
ncbi:DUF4238 domain-containing protein [Sphingomonas sp. HMP6]|uniref:DUF4238 domain-containing protein n=1 Tax=Sphingomonas sp. HMP6 TaxID=1517551 RepID=UPI001596C6D9|nr:DUF4238 domain-containing protein [Sphingomonas sp. HMP6]BCA58119.1 hypothetical protein HMP06_0888 [Sphingomonas sp. HMP6]